MPKKLNTPAPAAQSLEPPPLPAYVYGRETGTNERVWPEAAVRSYGDARAIFAAETARGELTSGTVAAVAAGEQGFEVASPCGRTWFVPLEKVREDYANFLVEADGLSKEVAAAKAVEYGKFIENWFCEQFDWKDVERCGRLVKQASPADITAALDFYRNNAASAPGHEYKKLP